MPDLQAAAQEPITEKEAQSPVDVEKVWQAALALKILKADFATAEQHVNTNHAWRFRNADELYLAWYPQRYWEGTRVPRSSIGIFVAFEQVESMLPQILSAIFSEAPDWFQCAPRPGTDIQQARDVQSLITYQCEDADTREQMRRAVKSALIYGNGILELGWEYKKTKKTQYIPSFVPKKASMNHPLMGKISYPTGEFDRVVKEKVSEETVNRPTLEHISIKDCYPDPNCSSPNPRDGKFFCVRRYKSVDELRALRGTEGFDIPDDATLYRLAKYKPNAQGDWTKGQIESYRSGMWSPQEDSSKAPGAGRIEVIAYWTKERLMWSLNREYLCLNISNPYGFIPFYNICYTDVPDRFFGLAVTDVIEGEQRLITAITNGRIDEVALALHPTRIKRRGVSIPQYMLRRRPGQIIEVENPKEDLVTEEVQNITQSAYIEVEAAERRVQKYTGITDLAVLGTPSSGGNSANRTATGISTQAKASHTRIQYLVENIEDQLIEPLLYDLHTLNTIFLDPKQAVEIVGQSGQSIQIDPVSVKNARVRFEMRASARMQTKAMMLQMFPITSQFLLNPEFMTTLAQQQQKKVNVEEVANMLFDATGYRSKEDLFLPMTPQELQAMQQPPMAEMLKMQMQQQRLQAQAEEGQQNRAAQSDDQDQSEQVQMLLALIQEMNKHHIAMNKPQPKPSSGNSKK